DSRSSPTCSDRSTRTCARSRTRSPTTTSAMQSSASAEGLPVKYQVVHTTTYSYSESVSVSHHLARLVPRTLPLQTRTSHQLQVDPPPDVATDHLDYFGNPMTFFIMQSAHNRLAVRARSVLELSGGRAPHAPGSPPS